jgi:hypothetical protein
MNLNANATGTGTGTTVPKTITRIRSEYYGYPVRYLILVLALAVFCVFLVAGLLLSRSLIAKAVYVAVLFGIITVFIKFFWGAKSMDRSWLMYQYFIRSITGKNTLAKYVLPASFLESIVPIRAFHDLGIIEFLGNKYGLLMRVEPSRISDDELDSHIAKGRSLVDALHGSLLMKFYVVSVSSNDTAIEKNVINIINKEERSQKQKQHLYSIYHHLQESTKTVIQWRYYIFVSLGEYKNLDEAKIARSQYMPGIESKLQKSGVLVMPLLEKSTLSVAYRQCLSTHGGI